MILETTLRDGSYAINFSFSTEDTMTLCSYLEKMGFKYIEVGHGVGLGASRLGRDVAVATDEEYMIAARSALKDASFGMFCIPGIAHLSDIDLSHANGMNFVRIGTDVTKIETSKEFIERAKKYGMFVAANYMKSYALSPQELAKKAVQSKNYGADVIYVVDSAGGMFPDDVKNYIKAIKDSVDAKVAFHGHDNLGLAVANSLAAIDAGADLVDSSLQGLGRSTGNACTEMLVCALVKRGFDPKIDYIEMLKSSESIMKKFCSFGNRQSIDVMAGFSDFHSSFMPKLVEAAQKHNKCQFRLMREICKVNRVEFNDEILSTALKTCA